MRMMKWKRLTRAIVPTVITRTTVSGLQALAFE
jgi:hypothetical protein